MIKKHMLTQLSFLFLLKPRIHSKLPLILLVTSMILFGAVTVTASGVVHVYKNEDNISSNYNEFAAFYGQKKIPNSSKEVDFNIKSLYVSKCKLTVYTGTGFSGQSYVYYPGKYKKLPWTYNNSSIESFIIEDIPALSPTVNLYFAVTPSYYTYKNVYDNQNEIWKTTYPEVKETTKYNFIKQNLGSGKYNKANMLSSTTYTTSHNSIRQTSNYYWINTIVIPKGINVRLTSKYGKSLDLPLTQSYEGDYISINLDDYPSIHKKIESIQIEMSSYKIKKIALEETSSSPIGEQQMGATSTYINSNYEGNGSHGASLEFSTGVSATNEWSSSSSMGVAVGASVSATVGVEVQAAPLGMGATANASATIEGSISSSIEKSFSKGGSKSVERSYSIANLCDAECPPRSECTFTASASPVRKEFKATTTLVKWDNENNREIPNSETEVESKLVMTLATEAKCYSENTGLADDPDKLPDDQKYDILESYYDFGDKAFKTSSHDNITSFIGKKPFVTFTEGRLIKTHYYNLLADTEQEKVQSLNQLGRYHEEEEYMEYIVAANATHIAMLKEQGYEITKSLGYIFKPNVTNTTNKTSLKLYYSPENSKYYSTSKDKRNPNDEEIGVQGFIPFDMGDYF